MIDNLFDYISAEEFAAETSVTPDRWDTAVLESDGTSTTSLGVEGSGVTMTYCKFCKGYYNDQHYGRQEEDNDAH